MPVPDIQDAIDLLERGKRASAIMLLEQITEALPAYAAAHVLLGRAYGLEGKWYEALGAWQRAQFLMPNSAASNQGIQQATQALSILSSEQDAAPAQRDQEAPEAVPAHAENSPFSRSGPDDQGSPSAWEAIKAEEAQEPPPGAAPDAVGFDDLDRLIQELESARIVPRPDLDNVPTPELETNVEDVVSETLARIYAAQKQYAEAAIVYEQLAGQQPERASEFLRKATEMRGRLSD